MIVNVAPFRSEMWTGVLEGKDYRVFFQPVHIEPPGLVKIDYCPGRAAVQDRMGINEQFFAALLAGNAKPFFLCQALGFHEYYYNR